MSLRASALASPAQISVKHSDFPRFAFGSLNHSRHTSAGTERNAVTSFTKSSGRPLRLAGLRYHAAHLQWTLKTGPSVIVISILRY